MRFRNSMKTLDTKTRDELLQLFDRVSYSLGFASLSTTTFATLDVEGSIVLGAYLLSQRELRLSRFVPALVLWLQRYHGLVNAHKLIKMTTTAEAELGDLALMRLVAHVLKHCDSRKYKNINIAPLQEPFYLEPRLKILVDTKVQQEGYYLAMPADLGIMISRSGLQLRDSDLISEDNYLKRNEQLRLRLLNGVNYRTDAAILLRDHPTISAKELSDTLCLSYEPAHRLTSEIAKYRSLGFDLTPGWSK